MRTAESKAKTSVSLLGHPVSEKVRQPKSKAYRERQSEITKKLWQDPEYALKHALAAQIKPTVPEKKLSYIIRHTCPHTFRYNGDARLRITFGGKIPDFVNVNGKKQVIELFGQYWHSEKKIGRTMEQEEQRFHSRYAKYGYKCLIIWERELEDKNAVKQRLLEFVSESERR